jgi:hypothetical protein
MTGEEAAQSHRHEERDVDPRAIALVGLVLAVGLVLIGFGGWFLVRHYDAREARRSGPPNPVAAALGEPTPPPPRLQHDPLRDLEQLRAAEEAALHGYGWVDRSAGSARIPIERAMELLATRGRASP